MKVTHGPQDPDESKNFTLFWFVCSFILFVAFFWSILDESFVRRPWKGYQKEFNRRERQTLQEQLKEKKVQVAESYGERLKALAGEMEKAKKERKSAAYKALFKEKQKKEIFFKDAEQTRSFTKSDLDEVVYLYEHAKLLGSGPAKIQKLNHQIKELEDQLIVHDKTLAEAEKVYLAAEKAWKEKEGASLAPEKEKEKIIKEITELEERIENIDRRIIGVKQVVVEGLGEFGRVDRCETCHVGINRAEFEKWPQPFTTHPRREELFGPHPPNKFGCTACHHGQGRALSSTFKAHGFEYHEDHGEKKIHYLHHWLEPMYTKPYQEASCSDCHGTQYRIPQAPRWQYATKIYTELGCHGCHLVEGYDKFDKVGPSLRKIGYKVEPEWLVSWVHEPTKYNPHTRMPNFRLNREEATAISAYLLSISEKKFSFPEFFKPGSTARGQEIFETVGCQGCHVLGEESRQKIDEYRQTKTNDPPVRDHGPDLSRIGEKVKPQWMYNWVRNPRQLYPHTRMPSLRLTEWQARSVTTYLQTFGDPVEVDGELRKLLDQAEWVEKGRKLIAVRGCYGCHDIQGFEKAERVGPELSNFGRKTLEEMFFGSTLDKDAPEKVAENWQDWTRHKLKKPNIFDTERIKHLMPTFSWRDSKEVETLMVFLNGQDRVYEEAPWRVEMTAERKAISRGQYLTGRYNCTACHLIEGKGGTIRVFTQLDSLSPPNLWGVGAKLQSDWLYKFLHRPSTVRPWLSVRMPSFQLEEKEYSEIVKYFESLDHVKEPYHDLRAIQPDPKSVAKGQRIFKSYDCLQCHILQSTAAGIPKAKYQKLAPNLKLAKRRLRPDWIPKWLAEPEILVPGTAMTAFWENLTRDKIEEIKELQQLIQESDDPEEQADLRAEIDDIYKQQKIERLQVLNMRDYLWSLSR